MGFGYRSYRACPHCLHCQGQATVGRKAGTLGMRHNHGCPFTNWPFRVFPVPPRAWWSERWKRLDAVLAGDARGVMKSERRMRAILVAAC